MSIKPKKPTKRELQAQKTRKAIFENAIKLFAEHSFDKVTIEDITEKAGVSTGTFYVYFASKDSILLEQFRLIDEHYREVQETLPETLSCTEKVMVYMREMCNFCSDTVGCPMMQIIYSNQCCATKRTEAILKSDDRFIYQVLTDLHREGVERGEFSDATGDAQFADMMMRASRGLIYDWCMVDGAFDLKIEGEAYLSHILNGYLK